LTVNQTVVGENPAFPTGNILYLISDGLKKAKAEGRWNYDRKHPISAVNNREVD